MTKLLARGALRREPAGEGADFVSAADVDDRALEDRVYREAIDHCLDLAVVERAAIAREEIVDRCTIFEVAFAHSPLLGRACPKPLAECRDVTLFHSRVEPRAVMHRVPCRFAPLRSFTGEPEEGRRAGVVAAAGRCHLRAQNGSSAESRLSSKRTFCFCVSPDLGNHGGHPDHPYHRTATLWPPPP